MDKKPLCNSVLSLYAQCPPALLAAQKAPAPLASLSNLLAIHKTKKGDAYTLFLFLLNEPAKIKAVVNNLRFAP